MPIKRISVRNFKSFSELDIDLSSLNIVIGSNAAGKSNFVSIFRFLRDIARNGLSNAIAMQGGPEYLRNTKIGRSRDLSVKVVYAPEQRPEIISEIAGTGRVLAIKALDSVYEFSIRFHDPGQGFSITHDELTIGCGISECEATPGTMIKEVRSAGTGRVTITSRNGMVTTSVDLPEGCPVSGHDIVSPLFQARQIREKTLLLETPYAYPLPHVEKFFDRIAVYDIDPKLPRKGVVVTGKSELDEDGGNLVLVIKLISENPEKRRQLANLIRDMLPFIEDFSVQKFMDMSLILTLRERYSGQQDLPASSISDGTIMIFALTVILYFEDRPFTVIEEPVGHIHPFLVSRLMAMIKEVSARKQLMVTTHSAEVVKHADLRDILLISRDSEGFSVVSRPADKEEVRTFLENDVGIEELYVKNLLNL